MPPTSLTESCTLTVNVFSTRCSKVMGRPLPSVVWKRSTTVSLRFATNGVAPDAGARHFTDGPVPLNVPSVPDHS